jgi:hypothetical protein
VTACCAACCTRPGVAATARAPSRAVVKQRGLRRVVGVFLNATAACRTRLFEIAGGLSFPSLGGVSLIWEDLTWLPTHLARPRMAQWQSRF